MYKIWTLTKLYEARPNGLQARLSESKSLWRSAIPVGAIVKVIEKLCEWRAQRPATEKTLLSPLALAAEGTQLLVISFVKSDYDLMRILL